MQTHRLCELLNIRYPIIQAGMVWASDWHLASACSSTGILGTLGLGSMSHEEIDQNIIKMKNSTFQAGQSSGLVADIVPVAWLVQRLIKEYNAAVDDFILIF